MHKAQRNDGRTDWRWTAHEADRLARAHKDRCEDLEQQVVDLETQILALRNQLATMTDYTKTLARLYAES